MSGAARATAHEIDGVSLRAFKPDDLAAAHALSEAVLWPHRRVDWEFALALGEGLVAERDGETVGTALAWKWGPRHATLGLVVVAPHCQGRRIGQRLMSGLLERLGPRTILLHATPEGRGLYERLGFVQVGEVRQHQGQALQAPLEALDPGVRLRPATQADIARLAALDAAAADMPREPLIRRLFESGDVVVLDHDGQARGFAVLRRFGRGQVIGPVVAPDAASARALIGHWVNMQAGRFLRIDTDFACGLAEWLESLGLRRAGNPVAMVRGPALRRGPPGRSRTDASLARARQYALVSQALG
jgi:GNAT superfamily N-acetyltransferase